MKRWRILRRRGVTATGTRTRPHVRVGLHQVHGHTTRPGGALAVRHFTGSADDRHVRVRRTALTVRVPASPHAVRLDHHRRTELA